MTAENSALSSEHDLNGFGNILALVEPLAATETQPLSIDEARHAMEQLAWLEAASSQGLSAFM